MPQNNDLKEQRNTAVKADVDILIRVKKMRTEAAFHEVGHKYYITPRTVAYIYYGEYEARRAKAAQEKVAA